MDDSMNIFRKFADRFARFRYFITNISNQIHRLYRRAGKISHCVTSDFRFGAAYRRLAARFNASSSQSTSSSPMSDGQP